MTNLCKERNNMDIKTRDQFFSYLKSHDIDIKDFKYSKKNNIYGLPNTEPISNPYLWKKVVDDRLVDGLEYLINAGHSLVNENIVSGMIGANHNADIITDKIFGKLVETIYINNKKCNFDLLSFACITIKKVSYLKIIMDFMNENKIKFQYDTFGNINRGVGLTEAAKTGDKELVKFLLDNGASIDLNDGFSFLSAMKHGCYEVAILLVKHGADPHMKNDLGFKLIQRNDKNHITPMGKNRDAYEELCTIYTSK